MDYVFFCKQNTAYEIRISDWSSDVCSSDLSSFDGIKASTYVGMTDKGDGFTHNEDLLWGKTGDWGSALVSATVASNREILAGDRDFSNTPLQGLSRNTPAGRFKNSAAEIGRAHV